MHIVPHRDEQPLIQFMTIAMDQRNVFLNTHLDALKLEIDLIEKIIIRNRCSHGKAKYFRLLEIAYSCLRKSNVLELYDDVTGLLTEVPEMCKSIKTKRKREEIFWEFQPSVIEKPGANENELDQLSKRLDQVANCVAHQLPLCLSRLVYASKFFFLEISRGFFLPFCVVTIGAVARTRTLIEQLGRFVLEECWSKLEQSWTEFRDLHGVYNVSLAAGTIYRDDFQKARSSFALSIETVEYNATISKVDRATAILRTLGVHIPLKSKGKKEETRKDPIHTKPAAEEYGCDHGEIVITMSTSSQMREVGSPTKGDSSSVLGHGSESGQVDRNLEILEKLKGKKKRKEKRPVTIAMDASKPNKKRKAKVGKKETGDFFDNLFSR